MKRFVLIKYEQCWTMIIACKSGVQAQFLAYIYMAYICLQRQSIKYKRMYMTYRSRSIEYNSQLILATSWSFQLKIKKCSTWICTFLTNPYENLSWPAGQKNQSWDETFSTIALNKHPSESFFYSMAKK
jgi:hypothetical protein